MPNGTRALLLVLALATAPARGVEAQPPTALGPRVEADGYSLRVPLGWRSVETRNPAVSTNFVANDADARFTSSVNVVVEAHAMGQTYPRAALDMLRGRLEVEVLSVEPRRVGDRDALVVEARWQRPEIYRTVQLILGRGDAGYTVTCALGDDAAPDRRALCDAVLNSFEVDEESRPQPPRAERAVTPEPAALAEAVPVPEPARPEPETQPDAATTNPTRAVSPSAPPPEVPLRDIPGTVALRDLRRLDGPGALPPAVLRNVLLRRRISVMRCYHLGLTDDPALEGMVVFRLAIGEDGRIADLRVLRQSLNSEPVTSCLAGVLQRLRIAPPARGGHAGFRLALQFEPRR